MASNRIRNMTDEEIEAAARSDPDARPLAAEQPARMKRVSGVKRLRWRLKLSQAEFAERFNIPLGTLRDWEQHRSEPDQAARAYLRVIEFNPEHVAAALGRVDSKDSLFGRSMIQDCF